MMGVIKHGYCRTPTYNTWARIIARCTNAKNPDFKNYGGRGIQVCERWKQFENFLADMGEKPVNLSIDRIDVNGNYEPNNCRWITLQEQNNNRRDTLRVMLSGVEMSAKQASERLHLPYERVRWAVQKYADNWLSYATSKNAGELQRNNTTGVRGVTFHKASGRYHTKIQKNGKVTSLGYYNTLEGAASARAAAEIGKGL